MLYANVGGISRKQELALEFSRSQNKNFFNLAETHMSQYQLHQLRNNWLGPIFCSPGDTFTKGMLVLLHLGFDDVTDVDIDPDRRFVSFKVAPSEDRVLSVFMHLRGIITNNSLNDYKTILRTKLREMKKKRNYGGLQLHSRPKGQV